MKKIMVIGAINSGKTSLLMALHGESGQASKTQTIKYKSFTIDTPGEYIENPRMYSALMSTSLEAKCIMFTQDSTSNKTIFPPKFARAFTIMTVGVITKIDHQQSDINKSLEFINQLGLKGPIFKVSAFTGEGIKELKNFIESFIK